MRLRVLTPQRQLVDHEVVKINGQAPGGAFGILPRHVDYATVLAPGLISYVTRDGEERFVALDGGMLVKRGPDVLVSARSASEGTELGAMRERFEENFRKVDESERRMRTALAQLELDLARRIGELGRKGRD